MGTTKLNGREAVQAVRDGWAVDGLHKYGDPVSGPADDLDPDDAVVAECLEQDPNLLWAEVDDLNAARDAGRTCAGEDYSDAQTAGAPWTAPESIPPYTSSVLTERFGDDTPAYRAAASAYLERCRELADET